jgi:RHH-type rel operon transcriptional repressor/antitoxin RelB
MLAVDLPPEIEARLDELAAQTGRSDVGGAVIEHLADLEDLRLAEQRLLDHRAGLSDSIPLEDVMKLYGMADRVRSTRVTRIWCKLKG